MLNDEEFKIENEKFRGIESHLNFSLPVHTLIDAVHCSSISKLIHRNGAMWERHLATPTLGESLPDKKGLYMFVWKPQLKLEVENPRHTFQPSWVVYVGKAGIDGGTHDTVRHRYQTEYSKYVGKDPSALWSSAASDSRHERLSRYLTLRPLEYWFLPVMDPTQLHHLERSLIKIINPPANRQHGSRLRTTVTEPA